MNTRLVVTIFAILVAEVVQARSMTLTCRDSGNLYVRPYTVVVDSRNLTLQINRPAGTSGDRRSYPIQEIETDSDGFSITARGRVLNSQIRLAGTAGARWIEYTDAFTDRTFAMDYCQ